MLIPVDFNDDDAICSKDLNVMIDMLTGGKMLQDVKDKIVDHVVYLLCINLFVTC